MKYSATEPCLMEAYARLANGVLSFERVIGEKRFALVERTNHAAWRDDDGHTIPDT